MKRTWPLWTIFALCLAIGLAAMVWISLTVLRLDRAEAEARRQAHVEENVRLALWRMDSTLAPIIAQETARPYFAYSAFTPAERAYTRMFAEIRYGEVLIPSPLLTFESPLIRVHFQYGPDGKATSPQAPTGEMRATAARYTSFERMDEAAHNIELFQQMAGPERLLATLPQTPASKPLAAIASNTGQFIAGNNLNWDNNKTIAPQQADVQQEQMVKSFNEFQNRSQNTMQQQSIEYSAQRGNYRKMDAGQVNEGVMSPLWIGDALVLARRVTINGQTYIQGCWLNWPAIRATLLEQIADLLPAAALEPIQSADEERQPRLLASIPVKLVPGAVPLAMAAPSPIRLTLAAAWTGVFIASAAIALLVWGAMSLSARRGAFVSAVTHELRTPLTTVSMYAEMLEEGMVRDEAQRQRYLGTLRAEAERLGHLVENVLAYSRIERGRAAGRMQDIPLPQLVDGVKQRLANRAEQAGMALEIDIADDAADAVVRADASAVEQVLFNLVDNAGKYAASADDRRIRLDASRNGKYAMVRISDHGPGIPPAEARKLFRPFSKSARDAANSAPGVGLGLALSRRLARQMRGDLKLESGNGSGASFVLTLPLA